MTKQLLKAAFAAADAGKDAFEAFKNKVPDIMDAVKKYAIRTCLWFLASFLITAPILFAGIFLEIKTLIIFAGVIRSVAIVIFRVMLAPVEIILGIITGGASGIIKRYVNSLSGLFIAELIVTAIVAWLPFKNDPDKIVMFILLTTIVSVLGSQVFNRKAAIAITSILLLLTTASLFFPYTLQSWNKEISGRDQEKGMPSRIDQNMTCSGFKRGEYKFFGDKEEALDYYYKNWRTHEIEAYVLNSKNITHPQTGERLKPINKEIIYELESQICAKEEKQKRETEETARKAKESAVLPPFYLPTELPTSAAQPESFGSPAPAPNYQQPNRRKEYAVIAMNEYHNQDRALGEEMVTWLGSNRSVYAYDYVTNISADESGISYSVRVELAKVARKIVYAVYKTRFDRMESGLSYCSATIIVKVIDADSGNIIKEIPKTYHAKEIEADKASQIALGFTFKAIENQFRKYM